MGKLSINDLAILICQIVTKARVRVYIVYIDIRELDVDACCFSGNSIAHKRRTLGRRPVAEAFLICRANTRACVVCLLERSMIEKERERLIH